MLNYEDIAESKSEISLALLESTFHLSILFMLQMVKPGLRNFNLAKDT